MADSWYPPLEFKFCAKSDMHVAEVMKSGRSTISIVVGPSEGVMRIAVQRFDASLTGKLMPTKQRVDLRISERKLICEHLDACVQVGNYQHAQDVTTDEEIHAHNDQSSTWCDSSAPTWWSGNAVEPCSDMS